MSYANQGTFCLKSSAIELLFLRQIVLTQYNVHKRIESVEHVFILMKAPQVEE